MTQTSFSHRRTLLILLSAGLLLVAVFSVITRHYSRSGHVTLPQFDSGYYMQYARAIAEGRPYQFLEGDPPTTGSTSHLYPFVLAVPYLLGARGDALVSAGFAIGGLCYLAIIALVYAIALKLLPERAVLVAVIAGVLNAHTLFACLGVTDVGLFAVLALAVIAAALHQRWKTAIAALVLAVFCRPEGAVLSAAFFGVGLTALIFLRDQRKAARPLLVAGVVGLTAVGAVAGLNLFLTGIPTFHSVLGKSRSIYFPPFEVLYLGLVDSGKMLRDFFFGLGDGNRQYYIIPVVYGLLGFLGLAGRERTARAVWLIEMVFVLAAVAAMGLVASSGWQGLFFDRYFAWLMPLWLIYIVIGLSILHRNLLKSPASWRILVALVLVFHLYALLSFATFAARAAALMEPKIDFLKEQAQSIPKTESIMTEGYSGTVAYYMPEHRIINLSGITQPDLTLRAEKIGHLEILKYRPDLRTQYWLTQAEFQTQSAYSMFFGERLDTSSLALGDRDLLGLFKADWSLIDYPHGPLTTETLAMIEGWTEVDRLDVGYPLDERDADYSVFNRYRGARPLAFSKVAEIGKDRTIYDVGRTIYGTESFTLRCPRPGQEMLVVLRTSLSGGAALVEPFRGITMRTIRFDSPLRLRVFVDGREVQRVERHFEEEGDDFLEVAFVIPGAALQREEVDLLIGGDHFSFGYWFYQQ